MTRVVFCESGLIRRSWTRWGIIVCLLISNTSLSADELDPSDKQSAKDEPQERLRQRREYERSISQFYRQHQGNLKEILAETDQSLMLSAYWRHLNRDEQNVLNYSQREFRRSRIVGMLEGMTHTPFPEWWEYSILRGSGPSKIDEDQSGRAFLSHETLSLSTESEEESDESKRFRRYRLTGDLKRLSENEDLVVFTLNGNEIRVDPTEIPPDPKPQGAVLDSKVFFLALDSDRSYIVLYDSDRLTFADLPIYCFDNQGKLIWKQYLYSSLTGSGGGYFPPSRCELILTRDSVLVIGASSFGAIVESFSKKDGSVDFRFSSDINED